MAVYVDNRGSNAITEKIKLFESPTSPSPKLPVVGKGNTTPHWRLKAWRKESNIVGLEPPKTLSFGVKEDKLDTDSTIQVLLHRPPTSEVENARPAYLRGGDTAKKESKAVVRQEAVVMNQDPQSSPRTNQDPQSSPRTKQKEKVVRLEVDSDTDDDDSSINLHRLSVDERQMVKNLVKITSRKNKMMDDLEESFRGEKQSMIEQFEAEKGAWIQEIYQLQQELNEKSNELRNKDSISNEMQNMLRKAHDDLHEAQITIATYKRVLADHKKNTDIELSNKSQTLYNMERKLGALIKFRDSMECIICEERVAKIVLNPCHHLVLCSKCSHLVSQCPMCRSTIATRFEVYSNWVV